MLARTPLPEAVIRRLGLVDYQPTWDAMKRFTDERSAETPDEIWFLEHPPVFTLGQYLRPTVNHLSVQRFVTPQEFDRYREWALARGFLECVSGPLVRSSYRAEQALNRNNAGLDNSSLAT